MINGKLIGVGCAGMMLVLSGCGTVPMEGDVATLRNQLESEQARIQALEESNKSLRAQAIKNGGSVNASGQYAAGAGNNLLPPNAKSGECYARVLRPATYKTVTKKIVAEEASEKVTVVPPKFEWVEERVLVREASSRLNVVPAKYDVVEERVLVEDASESLQAVPAQYENVTERVLVSAARSYWKRGRGPVEKVDNMTGEIMCLIEEPAKYETVTTRKLVRPASTRKVPVPAKYATIKKRVMVEAPKTVKVDIPAEYDVVRKRKLVSPGGEHRVPVPATYQTVSNQVIASESTLEWRSILCETNTTADVVSRMQRALRTAGYNTGGSDGVLGPQTMAALSAYQRANGLASGKLTMETLRKLRVVGNA